MKYWWLEKYKNLQIVQIKELMDDVNYFLVMPNDYEKQYLEIKNKRIEDLKEEELLILLKKTVGSRQIHNHLSKLIQELLKVPDNSFPSSDYTLLEMLEEIKKLKTNYPFQEKLENNNLAICYHCLNIFYIDKINKINKNNLCLCPYCHSNKLYFDNDYVPMNYTFIKLAKLYYHTSNLGCTFKEIQKIISKNVKTEIKSHLESDIPFIETIPLKSISPVDEKKIYRDLLLKFIDKDKKMLDQVNIMVSNKNDFIAFQFYYLLLTVIMEVLSSTIHLKNIVVIFDNEKDKRVFNLLIKDIKTF